MCCWIGPDAAFWLTIFALFVAGRLWLCHRFPSFGYFTGVLLANLIGGFISGLLGLRGGGYTGGYYGYRGRRRRRW